MRKAKLYGITMIGSFLLTSDHQRHEIVRTIRGGLHLHRWGYESVTDEGDEACQIIKDRLRAICYLEPSVYEISDVDVRRCDCARS